MKVIITGGAGFIGCNAASRYLKRGHKVIIIDNLSRTGSARNIEWLNSQGDLEFHQTDIRQAAAMEATFGAHKDAALVLHLAGQVAVTTSVKCPRSDFETNALGTFNVLEAIRHNEMNDTSVIYSSTNKVYGGIEEASIVERNGRYAYESLEHGVAETQGLDFYSPYGCSKGTGDQYMRDYYRIYGLKTVVMRQSCIYGHRQFGIEDQGWVAWFMIAALLGRPLSIYGDGKQVRDILFIEDLLDAYDAAHTNITACVGEIYNVGGGPDNVISLLDLLNYLCQRLGRSIPHRFAAWRPGDQRVYISDIRHASERLNWQPKINMMQGLDLLFDWIAANKDMLA